MLLERLEYALIQSVVITVNPVASALSRMCCFSTIAY